MTPSPAQPAHPPISPQDILRLKQCPRCDYDLTGLPTQGHCPECGFAYDESMQRLDVWCPDVEPRWWNFAGQSIMVLFGGTVTFGVVIGLMNGARIPLVAWLMAAIFVVFSISLTQAIRNITKRAAGDTSHRLVFCPLGYASGTDTRLSDWTPWDSVPSRFLKRRGKTRWQLRLQRGWWRRFLDLDDKYTFDGTACDAAAVRKVIRQHRRTALHTDKRAIGDTE